MGVNGGDTQGLGEVHAWSIGVGFGGEDVEGDGGGNSAWSAVGCGIHGFDEDVGALDAECVVGDCSGSLGGGSACEFDFELFGVLVSQSVRYPSCSEQKEGWRSVQEEAG